MLEITMIITEIEEGEINCKYNVKGAAKASVFTNAILSGIQTLTGLWEKGCVTLSAKDPVEFEGEEKC